MPYLESWILPEKSRVAESHTSPLLRPKPQGSEWLPTWGVEGGPGTCRASLGTPK